MTILTGVEIQKDGNTETMMIGSDFKVFERKISESYGKEIKRFFDGERDNLEKDEFDEKRNIFHDGGNMLIVEYNDKSIRDKDLGIHKKHFQVDRVHFSKELEGGLQIGELCGVIDYKGKYYIILDGLNKLIDRTDNIVFRGIIINPTLYFKEEVPEKVGEVVSRIESIIAEG